MSTDNKTTEAPPDTPIHDDALVTGEWVDCWNCGGDGEIEDEDWQFEGEFYQCDICEGKGGWIYKGDATDE